MRTLLLLLSIAGLPAAAVPTHESVNRTLADEVILPAYERWADAAESSPLGLKALCAAPDAAKLADARRRPSTTS